MTVAIIMLSIGLIGLSIAIICQHIRISRVAKSHKELIETLLIMSKPQKSHINKGRYHKYEERHDSGETCKYQS